MEYDSHGYFCPIVCTQIITYTNNYSTTCCVTSREILQVASVTFLILNGNEVTESEFHIIINHLIRKIQFSLKT